MHAGSQVIQCRSPNNSFMVACTDSAAAQISLDKMGLTLPSWGCKKYKSRANDRHAWTILDMVLTGTSGCRVRSSPLVAGAPRTHRKKCRNPIACSFRNLVRLVSETSNLNLGPSTAEPPKLSDNPNSPGLSCN